MSTPVKESSHYESLSKDEEKVLAFLSPMSSQDFRFSLSQDMSDLGKTQESSLRTGIPTQSDTLFQDSLLTRRAMANDYYQYQSQELSSSQQTYRADTLRSCVAKCSHRT